MRVLLLMNVTLVELFVMALFIGQAEDLSATQLIVNVAVGIASGYPYEAVFLERLIEWSVRRRGLLEEGPDGVDPADAQTRRAALRIAAVIEPTTTASSGTAVAKRARGAAMAAHDAVQGAANAAAHAARLDRHHAHQPHGQGDESEVCEPIAHKLRYARPELVKLIEADAVSALAGSEAVGEETSGMPSPLPSPSPWPSPMPRPQSFGAVAHLGSASTASPVAPRRAADADARDSSGTVAPPRALLRRASSVTQPGWKRVKDAGLPPGAMTVSMPDQALISIPTHEGQIVGFFVARTWQETATKTIIPPPNSMSILSEMAGVRLHVDHGQHELLEEAHRTLDVQVGVDDVRFVQAEHVYRRAPIPADEARRTYGILSMHMRTRRGSTDAGAANKTRRGSLMAGLGLGRDKESVPMVKMVQVVHLTSPYIDGRQILPADVIAQPSVAARAALDAYDRVYDHAHSHRNRTGHERAAAAELGEAGAADTEVGAAAASAHAEPVTRYHVHERVRLTRSELEHAQWWSNKPKRWKLRAATTVNVLLICAVSCMLLTFSILGGAGVRDPEVCRQEILVSWLIETAFKLALIEPGVVITQLVVDLLVKKCVPESYREWAIEVFVEPLLHQLRKPKKMFREVLGFDLC